MNEELREYLMSRTPDEIVKAIAFVLSEELGGLNVDNTEIALRYVTELLDLWASVARKKLAEVQDGIL